MPRLSIWTIRASLIYLALGFTLGGLMLFHKGVAIAPWVWLWLPAHIEFLLVGWTIQLVLGVAFWILPRFSRLPRRGNETFAWLAVIFLNAGILVTGLGPIIFPQAWLVWFGRFSQIVGATFFALHVWPRVRPTRAHEEGSHREGSRQAAENAKK
jgi:hypothetical protein